MEKAQEKVKLFNGDCYELIKLIPDNSVDLVIIDPPYEIAGGGSGGVAKNRKNYMKLQKDKTLNCGIDEEILWQLIRVMKKTNIYIWCNKKQLRKYLDFFDDEGCLIDLLTWHKSNPMPINNMVYLSDTEYLIFAKEKGVELYGDYHTKKKYYVTVVNNKDKKLYGHPTVKPLGIIENLIINSSKEGQTVLDCFMGSGTTGVASIKHNRNFIGMELNDRHFETAKKRILGVEKENGTDQLTLF